MEGLNAAFFNVLEKLLDLQPYFIAWAWNVARVVMLIALGFICVKHAINGQGLKEGLVKLGMSFTLFAIVINSYPKIIEKGNELMYDMASSSTYEGGLSSYFTVQKEKITQIAETVTTGSGNSYYKVMKSTKVPDGEPRNYFTELFVTRTREKSGDNEIKYSYTTLAPKAAMEIILLVAGEAMRFSDKNTGINKIGAMFKGLLTAIAVILTGVFGICEYLICMLEFMLVTSVGVILLPFMLWDSSKFLTEKLIGAIVGFFVKLLFCNICIFLMLYGFMGLAVNYTEHPFTGTADEIVYSLFTCILFFLICKSGPNLAQSLLTGSPSLNSGAAFAAVGGAVAGAGAALGLAGKAGGVIGGAGAHAAFAGAGAVSQAAGAAKAVGDLGGTKGDKAGAVFSSLAGSAGAALKSTGSNLAHSLLGGGASGYNRHSQLDTLKHAKQAAASQGGGGGGGGVPSGSGGGTGGAAGGQRTTMREHLSDRKSQGENRGIDYMAKKESRQASNA